MHLTIISLIFIYVSLACDDKNISDFLKNKLQEEDVIPDAIDKAPSELLQVTYSGGERVDVGNELTPTQVKDPPKVTWKADQQTFYTLAMFDLDVPSREDPKFREVNHWLIGNILGGNLDTGDVITEYLSSGPQKNTGVHRYIFLLFKQPKKIQFNEPRTGKFSLAHRINFNLRKFAEKYGLGEAVAGNFYKAQWDEYVDLLFEMLKNDS